MITLAAKDRLLLTLGSALSLDAIVELGKGDVVHFNHATATAKEVCSGPASIERIRIVNASGSSQTVTFHKQVTGNRNFQVGPTIDLAAGEAWFWDRETGPLLIDATGRVRVNNA